MKKGLKREPLKIENGWKFEDIEMIQASCGHEITGEWLESEEGLTLVKGYAKDGSRCIEEMVVCPKCLKWYRKHRLTTNQPIKWLKKGNIKKEV